MGDGPMGGNVIEGRREVELVCSEVEPIGGKVIGIPEDELDPDSLDEGGLEERGEEVVNREVEEREL